MRTIELDALSFIAAPNAKKFILIRAEQADDQNFLENFALSKILNRQAANKIPGVWGTLGYANDERIDWASHLHCSNNGNDDFTANSTVEEEAKLLQEISFKSY